MDWSEKSIEVLNLWSRLTEYNPLSSKNRRQKMVPISNTKGRMPNVTASSTHTTFLGPSYLFNLSGRREFLVLSRHT